MKTQDDIFKVFEGDNYFQRRKMSNRSDEERVKKDIPLKLIARSKLRFKNVAEVGAYNGFRLAYLVEKYACQAVAFEPSLKAIEEGRRKYPHIKFRHNIAAQLDAQDGAFDMVIIDFVFHWIDRRNLLRSIAEIDRITAEDGWLLIGDFWVEYPQRRLYRHLPKEEVWTYKQNYAEIYLASKCYKLVDSIFKKPSGKDTVPRCCILLQKSFTKGYPIVEEDRVEKTPDIL